MPMDTVSWTLVLPPLCCKRVKKSVMHKCCPCPEVLEVLLYCTVLYAQRNKTTTAGLYHTEAEVH